MHAESESELRNPMVSTAAALPELNGQTWPEEYEYMCSG